ncbi:MAG: hypothetical protein LBI39_00750 [Puniceicoccales bacterium]|jgi:hypothetical protein|nr:hypothetical protein [Puniceicoccales bacterium]
MATSFRPKIFGFALIEVAAAIAIATPILLLAGAALLRFRETAAINLLRAQSVEITAAIAKYVRENGGAFGEGGSIELAAKKSKSGAIELLGRPCGDGERCAVTLSSLDDWTVSCDICAGQLRRRFLLAKENFLER